MNAPTDDVRNATIGYLAGLLLYCGCEYASTAAEAYSQMREKDDLLVPDWFTEDDARLVIELADEGDEEGTFSEAAAAHQEEMTRQAAAAIVARWDAAYN